MTTTTLALVVTAVLLADGSVDWDSSLQAVKDQVDSQVQETKQIREDLVRILEDNNESYVKEDALVGKVLSRREQAARRAALQLDPTADVEEGFTMAETTALTAKINGFIDANRTEYNEDGSLKKQGIFQSRRGRNGGIQTADNAQHIKHLEDSKKPASKA